MRGVVNLSPNFTLAEFCQSQTAARLGRTVDPTEIQIGNATRLCLDVLEPIRTRLQRAIFILSGIRPEWLNAAVGGAANSAHLTGRGADVVAAGMTPETLARWIRYQGFPVDKCILEFPESASGGWVHLQVAAGVDKPRGEFLVARSMGGRTVYTGMEA